MACLKILGSGTRSPPFPLFFFLFFLRLEVDSPGVGLKRWNILPYAQTFLPSLLLPVFLPLFPVQLFCTERLYSQFAISHSWKNIRVWITTFSPPSSSGELSNVGMTQNSFPWWIFFFPPFSPTPHRAGITIANKILMLPRVFLSLRVTGFFFPFFSFLYLFVFRHAIFTPASNHGSAWG